MLATIGGLIGLWIAMIVLIAGLIWAIVALIDLFLRGGQASKVRACGWPEFATPLPEGDG